MKHKTLLSTLSLVFGIAFIFHLSSFVLHIYVNSTWEETKERTIPSNESARFFHRLQNTTTIYQKQGFEVPVKMDFHYADTIVQIAGKLNEKAKTDEAWIYNNDKVDNRQWLNTWRVPLSQWKQKIATRFDTIYKIDTLITKAIIDKYGKGNDNYWRSEQLEARYNQNVFDLTNFQRQVKSSINIKPKTSSQFCLLLFRANIKVFFYLFLFYQLFQAVRLLKSDFSFSPQFYHKIKAIGWAILVYSLLQFIADYSLQYFYEIISVEAISTAVNYIDNLHVYMYADYHFPFEAFSAGLLLIIFSTLIKRAFEIEQNWSLTI